MTTAAICAFGEVPPSPSHYRGEQYDTNLGLYYLRARYYNPNTGRFLSRDPEDGKATDPATLHKYLYANGDPVNMTDPNGREALIGYVKRLAKFTMEVPTLAQWGGEVAFCVVALAAAIEVVHDGGDLGIAGMTGVLAPCIFVQTHALAYLVLAVTGFSI
jgi:RHS repeat-associated protein